jgi:hypothetical protein
VSDEPNAGAVSRRSALKKIGAGAAIAWSAPVIMSIGEPAFAQQAGTPAPCNCVRPCGFVACAGGVSCLCQPTMPKGGTGCACVEDGGVRGLFCQSNADCPPLSACISEDCFGGGLTVCRPLCGQPRA